MTTVDSCSVRMCAGLKAMSPSYFGMAMATGIVSDASQMLGHPTLAWWSFQLNVVIFGVLCLLLLARLWFFPADARADFVDHLRSPGFFTLVAACGVVGSQCILVAGSVRWATLLWVMAVLLWIILTYAIFAVLTVKAHKPPLNEGINGGWLLAVVATQSVALLSALLAQHTTQAFRLELNFFALSMWLWGGMLYVWLMSLIFYRYTFFRIAPADLSPPYWINMGAMAISTLAGSLLILNAPDAPFLLSLLPFIKGFTVLYWATGTWWIPMLMVLAIWRHAVMRFPLRYDPLYWGAVFPLGMYAACTRRMLDALSFEFLGFLPHAFLGMALVAWTLTAIGYLLSLLHQLRPRAAPADVMP